MTGAVACRSFLSCVMMMAVSIRWTTVTMRVRFGCGGVLTKRDDTAEGEAGGPGWGASGHCIWVLLADGLATKQRSFSGGARGSRWHHSSKMGSRRW